MIASFRGVKCSRCGRKGLHFANHPHAFGYKDYDIVICRYCNGRFSADKVEARIDRERATRGAPAEDDDA